MLAEHKDVCWSISGAQFVRLEKEAIKVKSYFKQIPVPFKVYADFGSNLESVESYEDSYSKKCQDHIPCSFDYYKLVCVGDKFSKPILIFRGKNAVFNSFEAIFKEYECCNKVMTKHSNKNLVMSKEEEKGFQSSNTCCICEKRIDDYGEKVRGHYHITGKFKGAAHWSCNIFVSLTNLIWNLM